MKFRPVGAEIVPCGRTDGTERRTDMTKLIVAVRNFVNVPEKGTETIHAGCWKYCIVHTKAEIVAKDAIDKKWNSTHRIVARVNHAINMNIGNYLYFWYVLLC